jgi:hypothetical protein
MARRRRPTTPRRDSARLRPEREGVAGWPGPRATSARRSLLPTLLWSAGALLTAVPLVAIIVVALTQPLSGTRWGLIGVIFLLAVFVLAMAVMALQAFLNWKDPD